MIRQKLIKIIIKKMKIYYLLFCLFIFSPLQANQSYDFSFSKNTQGWVGDFADYPVGEETFYELEWGWENLPTPYASFTKGLFLSGNNHSDDLFMFVRHRIEGLQPNTLYALTFSTQIESNVPPSQLGVGGSPGESVYVKVGAARAKPEKINQANFYLLNVDKGDQSQGGENALVIGNLANPAVDPAHPTYQPKELSNGSPLLIKSDQNGRLWVFLGTDSAYEGTSKFYISEIKVTAIPVH